MSQTRVYEGSSYKQKQRQQTRFDGKPLNSTSIYMCPRLECNLTSVIPFICNCGSENNQNVTKNQVPPLYTVYFGIILKPLGLQIRYLLESIFEALQHGTLV